MRPLGFLKCPGNAVLKHATNLAGLDYKEIE